MSGAPGVMGGPPKQKQDPQKEPGSLRPDPKGVERLQSSI